VPAAGERAQRRARDAHVRSMGQRRPARDVTVQFTCGPHHLANIHLRDVPPSRIALEPKPTAAVAVPAVAARLATAG
jgi:hypothetical protein